MIENEGSWQEERWTIEEIKPALLHVVQDIVAKFEQRFPQAPFFVKKFRMGSTPSIADLSPMIGSLHADNEHREAALRIYREQVLPLGFVAESVGRRISEVMDYMTSEAEPSRTLLAEWADRDGQQSSLSAVTTTDDVVLTESALQTALRFDSLELMKVRFKLVAPRSLLEAVRDQLGELERVALEGQKLLSASGPGLQLVEVRPGDSYVIARRDKFRELVKWLEQNVKIAPRPLNAIGAAESEDEQLREMIGASSYDSIALALELKATLYADDLGLRALGMQSNVPSFSTIALLSGMVESGEISRRDGYEKLLALAELRYTVVVPSVELIPYALESGSRKGLLALLSNVGPPYFSLQDAARLGAQAVRAAATIEVQTMSIRHVTEMVLDRMAAHWSRPLSAQLLLRSAMDQLALMPRQLNEVNAVCGRDSQPPRGGSK
jgi:predicted nucleic acid-binding protein